MVYFNDSANGRVCTFDYYGRGVQYIPSSKIYVDRNGSDVTKTLEDIIESGQNAISQLEEVNTIIDNANNAIDNANGIATSTASAELLRVSAESARVTAENTRKTNETARQSSETSRVGVESARVTAETNRVSAETSRVSVEANRVTAEGNRATSETARNTAETNRVSAESARVSSETTRGNNETNRQSNETTRGTSETNRNTAETGRVSAESARVTAEGNRVSAESLRASNETIRGTNETNRVSAESVRVTAESVRNGAESGRVTAEGNRASAESVRQSNETNRQAHDTASQVWETYIPAKSYIPLNKVSYLRSSYVCILNSTGNLPTNTTYWTLIASKGSDGTGVGTLTSISSANADIVISNPTTTPVITLNSGIGANKIVKLDNNGQQPATSISLADAGNVVVATDAEGAIQELAGVGRTTETIKGNSDKIGLLSSLATTIKSSIVNAIGEIVGNIGSLGSLLTTAKTSIVNSINELYGIIQSGVQNSPTIIFGINSKISGLATAIFPKWTFKGQSYVNLLGKDGNCEDVTKWSGYLCTLSLDSINKVFGNNGMKITLTSTSGQMQHAIPTFVSGHYYMCCAYVKNGNATNISLQLGNTAYQSFAVTDTTAFYRVGFIFQSTGTETVPIVTVNGAINQYGYADGYMIVEITSADFATGLTACLTKYPYGESYVCTQNLYAENRRGNLHDNGNCEKGIAGYLLQNVTFSVENGKFKNVVSSGNGYSWEVIPVKSNTNYYISGNTSGTTTLKIYGSDGTTVLRSGAGTFNTGNWTSIQSCMTTTVGTGYGDSIILIEGTVAPLSYISCDKQAWSAEVALADPNDVLYLDGDKPSGLLYTKHRWNLYGKDNPFVFTSDSAGFKTIGLPMLSGFQLESETVIKYDGKPLVHKSSGSFASGDNSSLFNGNLYISIADIDSGWAETVNPNNSEALLPPNGWKACNVIGSRYTQWLSMVDGSYPSIVPSSLSVGTNASGQKTLNVVDGTKFVVGDYVLGLGSFSSYITAITGNQLTLFDNLPVTVPAGLTITRQDNGTTDTRILTWCMNNVAPNFSGYQSHYKLVVPEPITDTNCHIHGTPWELMNGVDNYINVDTGMVLGEVANPILYIPEQNYYINYMPNDAVLGGSAFKNKTDNQFIIYKNGKVDNTWVLYSSLNANGKYASYETLANFEGSAIYTVDYKILATQVPQIATSIGFQYTQDIVSAVSANGKAIEGKQQADSAFDSIRDKKTYEELWIQGMAMSWAYYNSYLMLYITLPYTVEKATKPNISIKPSYLLYKGSSGVSPININNMIVSIYTWTDTKSCRVSFYISDATTISDIKTYGAIISPIGIIADCKGKV